MIVLDEYMGKGTERNHSERLAAIHINESDLVRESTLFKTKWWDYRRLHQTEATWLFMAFYVAAVKRAHKRHFDRIEGIEKKGLGRLELFQQKKPMMTALWRARQAADIYGIPYGYFCSFAIEALMSSHNHYKQVPRPSQLYTKDNMSKVTLTWARNKQARVMLASNSFFMIENYQGHLDQDAYQNWVGGQIGLRENPEFALAHLLGKHISEAVALKHVEENRVNRAIKIIRENISHG